MSLFTSLQYLVPQHLLSRAMGRLANLRQPWLKDFFIHRFMKKYHIHLSEAVVKTPSDYACFNDFFIRKLDMQYRPMSQDNKVITCPVDGCISQIAAIQNQQLIQAKGQYYDLESLLGSAEDAQPFTSGAFATLYLAPHDYHRIHMPMDGKLIKTIYIPGKLFSVNPATTAEIPQLFSRNERLVCLFETSAGLMAVVLVGAMIVGSIQTTWMNQPVRASQPVTQTFDQGIQLRKGEEMGYFKLGSTVILLFPENSISWEPALEASQIVRVRQDLGKLMYFKKTSSY